MLWEEVFSLQQANMDVGRVATAEVTPKQPGYITPSTSEHLFSVFDINVRYLHCNIFLWTWLLCYYLPLDHPLSFKSLSTFPTTLTGIPLL